MPFEKGHTYHAPKDGRKTGTTKRAAAYKRSLTEAIRNGVGIEALMEYHRLRAMGHAAKLDEIDDEGTMGAVCMCHPAGGERDPMFDGNRPGDKERTDSVNWLTDRGVGGVVQMTQVDAMLRVEQATTNLLPGFINTPLVFELLEKAMSARNVDGTSAKGGFLEPPAAPALPPPSASDAARDPAIVDAVLIEDESTTSDD